MCAKYGEDPSTNPEYDLDLWLEVGAIGGLDKNQVYGIFMIITRYMRLGYSVSTVSILKFSLSQPSPAVEELIEQRDGVMRVGMKAKYEEQKKAIKKDNDILVRSLYFSYEPPWDLSPFSSPSATRACN